MTNSEAVFLDPLLGRCNYNWAFNRTYSLPNWPHIRYPITSTSTVLSLQLDKDQGEWIGTPNRESHIHTSNMIETCLPGSFSPTLFLLYAYYESEAPNTLFLLCSWCSHFGVPIFDPFRACLEALQESLGYKLARTHRLSS